MQNFLYFLNESKHVYFRARMQYGVDSSFKTRLQQYFVENYKSSFRIRGFNLFIKVGLKLIKQD